MNAEDLEYLENEEKKKQGCCSCISKETKEKYSLWVNSPKYELFVNVIGITNIFSIMMRQIDISDSTNFMTGWIIFQIVLNIIFLMEILNDFVMHGVAKSYSTNFRIVPETMC